MRATSPVMQGQDFLIAWVCTEAEWLAFQHMGAGPQQGVPWPVEALRSLSASV